MRKNDKGKKLRNFLNNFSLKKKLLYLYVISFLLPVVIFTIFLNIWIYRSFLNHEIENAKTSLNQTEVIFKDILENVGDLSDRLYVNKTIQDVILRQYKNTLDVYNTFLTTSFLDDFLKAYKNIISIRIYNTNNTLLQNSFFIHATHETIKSEWYKKALQKNGNVFWTLKDDDITHTKYLSIVRAITDQNPNYLNTNNEAGKPNIGVLSLNVHPDRIARLISAGTGTTLILLNGKTAYCSSSSDAGHLPGDIDGILLHHKATKYTTDDVAVYTNIIYKKKKSAFFVKKFSPRHGYSDTFELISVISMNSITYPVYRGIALCILLLLAVSVISLFSIMKFSAYFQNRVNLINEELRKVVQQDFQIEPSIDGTDEFAEIYHSLVTMTENTKKLINEVYLHKVEQQQFLSRQNDIRFKMLAAQINPHFLFNTLETIRMTALAENNKQVAHILKILAKILRYNLSVTDNVVSLYSEIEAISAYLDIQHLRFGNRLSYDIIPTCNIQKISILPLLIQPLVENALNHGLHDKTNDGFLTILIELTGAADKKYVKIHVQDNGCGMSEKELQNLRTKMEKSSVEEISNSIGMVNVYQRIKLYYGEPYGVTIESTKNKGTCVTISVPYKEFHGEIINV